MDPIIIIGTGMAGYSLAREFRKIDKDTSLILISSDNGCSYPKPMLSSALDKGKTADQIALSDASKMEKTLRVTIITNSTVEKINPHTHSLTMEDGSQYHYKKLVLAVGASPRILSIEGNATKEILSINNLSDYTYFREKLIEADHVALVGSGLIGCEFANDLIANTDLRVSVIGPSSLPMETVLPDGIAKQLQHHLAEAGVEWHLQTTTKSINYNDKGYELALSNDVTLYPDLVVSAIGLRANIELASQASLAVNYGIVTNEFLQTTDDDIHALGDCAEVMGHHLLFVAPLLASAKALAKTLAGEKTAVHYPAMPIAVKTSLYPIVVATTTQGEWVYEEIDSNFGLKALLMSRNDSSTLLGFALSGDAIIEKHALIKQLPTLIQ
jgi:rubredoxin-NAD+ reductase